MHGFGIYDFEKGTRADMPGTEHLYYETHDGNLVYTTYHDLSDAYGIYVTDIDRSETRAIVEARAFFGTNEHGGANSAFGGVNFSPDKKRIAFYGYDGTLYVISAADGEVLFSRNIALEAPVHQGVVVGLFPHFLGDERLFALRQKYWGSDQYAYVLHTIGV
jgi:outer membrane protein assembly factor BamB